MEMRTRVEWKVTPLDAVAVDETSGPMGNRTVTPLGAVQWTKRQAPWVS